MNVPSNGKTILSDHLDPRVTELEWWRDSPPMTLPRMIIFRKQVERDRGKGEVSIRSIIERLKRIRKDATKDTRVRFLGKR